MKQRNLFLHLLTTSFNTYSCNPLQLPPLFYRYTTNSNGQRRSRLGTFPPLWFTPKEEVFEEPTEFGVSLRLTSHQSSSSSPVSSHSQVSSRQQQQLSSTTQYNPDTSQWETLTVWIIDDEKPILDAVGAYLCQVSGYNVRPFLNATVPLSLLREKQLPNAIICDVTMPGLSGIEFLSMIRSSNSFQIQNIPFILLTAKGMTEDRIRGYDAGTDGYLMKPFDPEELVVMLDRLVQRKLLLQEDDESVTIEELREDLSEVKELLTREERLLSDSQQAQENQRSGSGDSTSATSLLSDDEIQILEFLCEGYMNKEIASELKYSTRWVEGHLTSMFRKTSCGTRTELVRWAVANEYVDI
mmetsp:Transcript_27260/g.40371  ORF Transcript_27260/g.40371 Transcript_27260/m.40371 type:complete len:356 (-) Transcript_27260:57-1124(-)